MSAVRKNEIPEHRKNNNFVQLKRSNMAALRQLIKDNPTAAELFMFLSQFMDRNNAVSASSRVLQEAIGKSRTTVHNAVKTLKDGGFVHVLKSGSSNVYVLNPEVVWSTWRSSKSFCKFEGQILVSKSENQEIEQQLEEWRVKQLKMRPQELSEDDEMPSMWD